MLMSTVSSRGWRDLLSTTTQSGRRRRDGRRRATGPPKGSQFGRTHITQQRSLTGSIRDSGVLPAEASPGCPPRRGEPQQQEADVQWKKEVLIQRARRGHIHRAICRAPTCRRLEETSPTPRAYGAAGGEAAPAAPFAKVRRAHSSVFCMSMAIVMGPTPPGTGVIIAATFALRTAG